MRPLLNPLVLLLTRPNFVLVISKSAQRKLLALFCCWSGCRLCGRSGRSGLLLYETWTDTFVDIRFQDAEDRLVASHRHLQCCQKSLGRVEVSDDSLLHRDRLRRDAERLRVEPEVNDQFFLYQTSGLSQQYFSVTTNDLRTLLLNQVAVKTAPGIARKEFIPNLAGNFLIFNNETGEVSGTAPTTDGFRGSQRSIVIPRQISTDASNGNSGLPRA